MAIVFIFTRSPEAGWTIIAASTLSNAPRSAMNTLPPPPSSAGVPSIRRLPPSFEATFDAAIPAPNPAVPMMLCPHACPISGSASYSQSTATQTPSSPTEASKAVSRS